MIDGRKRRRYFCMYSDYRPLLEKLTNEQRGKLLIALYNRFDGASPIELDPVADMAACAIFRQMDYDAESYAAKCEKNRRNGSMGGISKRNRLLANAGDSPQEKEKEKEKEKQKEDIPPISPKRGKPVDCPGFNAFYSAYPRHEGKAAAIKAWNKLAPDDTLQQCMVSAVEKQKGCEQWARDDGKFIPYPATWINGRRWEDETEVNNNGPDTDEPAPDWLKGHIV